jgi:hypothetical protein
MIEEWKKAADEVRDELIQVDQSKEYNQGVDDAVERMKKRWEMIENE